MYKEIFVEDNDSVFDLVDFLTNFPEFYFGHCKITVTQLDLNYSSIYTRTNNEFIVENLNKKSPNKTVIIYYILDGFLHNDLGPASIRARYKGSTRYYLCEEYFNHGKPHRDGGLPANIESRFDKNKNLLTFEAYYINGAIHRDEGPAEINYENGVISRYTCFKNGLVHCETGPAICENNNGTFTYSYALNGEYISYEEYLKKMQTKLYW